jgi:hypothetical protein
MSPAAPSAPTKVQKVESMETTATPPLVTPEASAADVSPETAVLGTTDRQPPPTEGLDAGGVEAADALLPLVVSMTRTFQGASVESIVDRLVATAPSVPRADIRRLVTVTFCGRTTAGIVFTAACWCGIVG